MWLAGSWSKCDLVFNTSCGGGLQSRDVYCVRIGGETSEEVLFATIFISKLIFGGTMASLPYCLATQLSYGQIGEKIAFISI